MLRTFNPNPECLKDHTAVFAHLLHFLQIMYALPYCSVFSKTLQPLGTCSRQVMHHSEHHAQLSVCQRHRKDALLDKSATVGKS